LLILLGKFGRLTSGSLLSGFVLYGVFFAGMLTLN
jgi:hypothetical protein